MPPIVKGGEQSGRSASIVSLVGGVAVACAAFVLTLLLCRHITPSALLLAAAIALGVGVYIRVADM